MSLLRIFQLFICSFLFIGAPDPSVAQNAVAQNDSVYYKGVILGEQHEPIGFAMIHIIQNGKPIGGTVTDTAGRYVLVIAANDIAKLSLFNHEASYLKVNIPLRELQREATIQLQKDPDFVECTFPSYRVPLIDPWEPTQRTFTSDEIEKMAR